MPTGYTAGVADGTITDFTEYALTCARAFGACIMRDIPEFQPSDYHEKRLAESESQLSTFLAMSESDRREMHASEHTAKVADAERNVAERKQQLERYEAMLAKAKSFECPSPEHKEYAKFLVSQLEESIRFDCDTSYYADLIHPITFEEWKYETMKRLAHSIDYHRKSHREEVERTESRNRWVRQLKEALTKGNHERIQN